MFFVENACFEVLQVELINNCYGVVDAARFPSGLLKGSALVKIDVNDFFPLVLVSSWLHGNELGNFYDGESIK